MAQVKGHKLSKISVKHYAELVFRSLLFLGACFVYVTDMVRDPEQLFGDIRHIHPLLWVVWLVLIVEMILRFFPSSLESRGCQKQFPQNYQPRGETHEKIDLKSWKSTLAVTLLLLLCFPARVIPWLIIAAYVGSLVPLGKLAPKH